MAKHELLKEVWNDPFKRYLAVFLVILGILLLWAGNSSIEEKKGDIHFFYHPQCPHCHEQMEFNPLLEEKYGVDIVYHDVTQPGQQELFMQYAIDHGVSNLAVPATFFGEYYNIGFDSADTTGAEIEGALQAYLGGEEVAGKLSEKSTDVSLPFIGTADAMDYSLPALAILLGLIDGFNPCAMWVLVYMISIIIGLNDRNKIWLIVGSFVFASGVLYFLFMTFWLNVFLLIGYVRLLTILVGLGALWIGANDLRKYFSREPIVCEVGDPGSKKKTVSRIEKLVSSPLTWGTIIGIIALAFVVNSIEFACSSALPVIFTQVLALSGLSGLSYYLYILLYVFFFMLDDLIIFSLAAFAVNTSLGDKYARQCKLIGGVLLVFIGILLLFAPGILA